MQDRGKEDIWPHRLALVTASATFPLLFIGGLVTSKGAGLAVPDWPTTFGYNMFSYPWSQMVGDIFYEHGHRLVASGVGFLTLFLALVLWFYEKRVWLRWLGAIALALVIVQGVMGGLRVVLKEETLAIIHACFAQAFFALTVSLVFFTSAEWRDGTQKTKIPGAVRIQRLSLLTTAMIYFQGLLGAMLRYTGARLDAHLLFAVLVVVHVVALGWRVLSLPSDKPRLLRPVLLLSGLLVIQLTLGVGSYLIKFTSLGMTLPPLFGVVLRTTHVVTGALMLVTGLVLTLKSYRFLAEPDVLTDRRFLSERVPA